MMNDDMDTNDREDSGDELEESGMHLVSDEDGEEDGETDAEAPKAVLLVEPDEEETPKDGLAELEELEKALEEDRNGDDASDEEEI